MTEFICPVTQQPLRPSPDGRSLVAPDGRAYPIVDGIPELLSPDSRVHATSHAGQESYRAKAREYDRGLDVLFQTFGADEPSVRDGMIALLDMKAGARVLETGCGTGRDTIHLAGRAATLYATDLSREMIEIARVRLADAALDRPDVRLCLADAIALPFPDGFFDAAYHFGGINLFPDVRRGIAEMARVVKTGGKVVFGDEGLGGWLSETEFGRILVNSNPLYRHRAPIDLLPPSARDVTCRWILNGAFYVIDFAVGAGDPPLDLDVEFPGWRGGSHRTRYYGRLDGVDPGLRARSVEQAAREGLSLTAWLERLLRRSLPPA